MAINRVMPKRFFQNGEHPTAYLAVGDSVHLAVPFRNTEVRRRIVRSSSFTNRARPPASGQRKNRLLQMGIPAGAWMPTRWPATSLGHSAVTAIEMAYGNLVASPTELYIALGGAAVDLRIDGISARMHTRESKPASSQITPGAVGVYYLHVDGGSIHQKPWEAEAPRQEGVGGFDGHLMNGDVSCAGTDEPPSDPLASAPYPRGSD